MEHENLAVLHACGDSAGAKAETEAGMRFIPPCSPPDRITADQRAFTPASLPRGGSTEDIEVIQTCSRGAARGIWGFTNHEIATP